MKDFTTLKILDVFKFIFNRFGVDYPMMRKILQIKLIVDERRVPTVLMNKDSKENENLFNKSLLMYLLMGFIFMLFMLPPFPLFYKMNVIVAMILFLATSVMVSDYSSVLLDIKEKNILLPKPIENKTINAARMIHIFIYLFTIILTMAGPTLIAGTIKYGIIFGFIFIIQLLFMGAFIIFLTALLYFLILHFFNGEGLKDIINYFQIGLSVVMVIVYQLVGRIFQVLNLDVVYIPKWWNYLIPTIWFSAPYGYFIEGIRNIHMLVFTLLGIIVPTVMLLLYFKKVAPYFEGSLQKLHHNSGRISKDLGRRMRRHKKIAGLFSTSSFENTFFRFTQNMIASERTLKLKLYPSLAFATILPIIFIMNSLSFTDSLGESLQALRMGNHYLYLYFSVSMMATTVTLLSVSEKNKAIWLYRTLPIEDVNAIYKGSLKGFISKYIMPIYSFVGLIFIVLYGVGILLDVVIIFLNLVLLMLIIFHYSHKPLPFSQDFQYIKHNNITVVFQTFMFCGVAAGLHWFFVSSNYSRIPYLVIVSLGLIVMWKRMFAQQKDVFDATKAVDME